MRNISWRAGFGVTFCFVLGATTARADNDSDWARQAFAAAKAEPATPSATEQTRTVKRSSKILLSGLARAEQTEEPKPRRSSGGGCIPGQLQGVLNDLEAKFGRVNVTSTCRSASANRAAGGAPQSLHLSGQAVDFRVSGGSGAVMAFLSAHGDVGGLKHYGGGLYHIDTGARRPF
jgi:uncharacterized protein YcbK (DUF882 family)